MPADNENRFIVITGANTGIGAATAKALAARGDEVVLACRSREKTAPVVDAIRAAGGKAEFAPLDLTSFDSVRAAAEAPVAKGRPIDVLLNNAGVGGQRGLTRDGFELEFGTNHLGHFLLTMKLLPLLRAAASAKGSARIVNVSSKAHYDAKKIDFDALRVSTPSLTGLHEYAVSKLANVLFAKECAVRLAGSNVHSYALHPGVVASDAWRRMPWPIRPLIKLTMISNEEGAKTSLHCANSPEAGKEDGLYYDEQKPKTPSALAQDAGLARTLWEKSVGWTGADIG